MVPADLSPELSEDTGSPPSAPAYTVSAESRREQGEVYAALDLGTNNCRLLVARGARRGFRVIDAFSRIVRLGEGLAASGKLSDAAMDRTIEALRVCATKVSNRKVTRARYIATEACRRAANCGEFMERVRHETGFDIEIIPTEEEARLVVAGCAPLLESRIPHALVFDIGGGSTELAWLRTPRHPRAPAHVVSSMSLPYGVVTLSDRHGGRDVTPASYAAMVAEVKEAILPFEAQHGIKSRVARGEVQMLGSSGTVTTLAGVYRNLPRYNRALIDGTHLSFEAIREVIGRLASMTYEERASHPCIGGERADLVLAGCAILQAICELWTVGGLRVADRGIREGILFGLLDHR